MSKQKIDITGKNVLIIGYPASGKTHVANKLFEDNGTHAIIHGDSYSEHGFVEGLYVLIDDLKVLGPKNTTIIEGVIGYRLLRKGVELNCYYPDIVIELRVPEAVVKAEYAKNRKGKNYASLKGFNKALDKILNDYKAMKNPHPPKWITLDNSYAP